MEIQNQIPDPDSIIKLQERFSDLWLKVHDGTATPEEEKEFMQIQEDYWKNKN